MFPMLRKLVRDESGQDIIEYALLAAGIAIVAIPIIPPIGQKLISVYQNIAAQVQGLP